MKNKILMAMLLMTSSSIFAQNVGVNSTGATPDVSSILDVFSINKGMLIPRVALTGTTDAVTIATPATSLFVYNAATSGVPPNDVSPGYYYNAGTPGVPNWVRFMTGNGIPWVTTGNLGTSAATNFLGTTDAIDLVFRTNNVEKMRVMSGGNVGIGDASPAALFTVGGGDLFQVLSTGHALGIFGTAAAPSFSFVGDADNGLYRSAVNEMSFSTATTQRMVIQADGDVGIAVAAPLSGAILDVTATNKGLLIPRVALTSTTDAATITTPTTSLLVYNSATAGAAPNNVIPGYYYNSGTSGAPIWKRFSTGNGDAWLTTGNAGTNGGSTLAAGTNFIGTTDNQNIDFRTNNTYRGRFSNLGEFFVGTFNTVITGDLMNAVSNATFPWAINGYSNFDGSGVYGQVTGGATIFAGVQGEYNGTSASGAGVRGLSVNTTAGTSFGILHSGVSGNATTAGAYKFGTIGFGGTTPRSGGVLGNDYSIGIGALGYYSAGLGDYAVYGFGQAHTTGGAGGFAPGGGGGSSGLKSFEEANNLTEPNSMIGLGIYGGVMGGWVRGMEYGFHAKGNRYSLYVDGTTFTNKPITQLIEVGEANRIPAQATIGLTADVQTRGKAQMIDGQVFVEFDPNFIKSVSDIQEAVITVTPKGNTNGVYVSSISPNGFTVMENNGGTSSVEISWIAVGVVVGFENMSGLMPDEIISNTFDSKMDAVMFNDNNTVDTPGSLWWDGSNIRFDVPPVTKVAPLISPYARIGKVNISDK